MLFSFYSRAEAKFKLVLGLMALNGWCLVIWHAGLCIVGIVFTKCQGCIKVTKQAIFWHQSTFCCQHQRLLRKMLISLAAEYILTVSASCVSSDKWAMPRSKQRHSLPSQLVNEMQQRGQTCTQIAHQTPDRLCENWIVWSNEFHHSWHVTQRFSDSYFSFCLWKQTPGKGGSQSSESEQPSADMNNESSEVTWI